jgi:hypothetical protein
MMSKLMKATLIGLAAAALGAPLAHADVYKAPRDVGHPADVGRPSDAFGRQDVRLGRRVERMNPLKMGSRPNPWKVGGQQRLLPWASRNGAAY